MASDGDGNEVREVDVNMSISRGLKPDGPQIDLSALVDLTVYDACDKQLRFGDLYKDQCTIVIFIRNFLCFMCKEYVDDLALIPEKYLKTAGVKLVVIGCSPTKFIQPFRDITGFKFPLYCDPDRKLFKKIGCLERSNYNNNDIKGSRHVKSSFLMGILKSTWRSMKHKELQGDMDQQGGAFILGPGEVVHFKHWDQSPADHAPINDLLALAGVEPVNFQKDARVFTI